MAQRTDRRMRAPAWLAGVLLPFAWSCSGGGGGAPAGEADGNGGTAAEAIGGAAGARVAYDWLIAGGVVVDGSGAVARPADVLLRDGRIAFVGAVDPDTIDAADVYHAAGRVVTPGFIDLHAHGNPVQTPGFENFLAMGVTTIVLGLDGTSPGAAELGSHLDAVRRAAPGVNVAYLVGHNTVRVEAGVGFGAADAAGRAAMADLVERALAAGAFGLSLGLEYDPGIRADLAELVAVAAPVAARNGILMAHLRTEDTGLAGAALAELLEVGRLSGAHVHASHLKIVLGRDTVEARAMLRAMAEARAAGVHATGDVYPYTASFTGLAILFPEWARPPNDYARASSGRRSELLEHLRRRVESRNGPGATLFGSGRWAGRSLEEVAVQLGRPFEEILLELGPGGARAAYFVMDDAVMAAFLRDPFIAVATDGGPSIPHPRGYGSFARVIRRHVVEDSLLTLEEAVRKMSGLPASVLGLDASAGDRAPRGMLRAGWAADVVVFDPQEVEDRADYQEPNRLADGMARVWVNGRLAWTDGRAAPGRRHGEVLTR